MQAVGRGVKRKKQTVEKSQELSIFRLHHQGITTALWGDWTLSWGGISGATTASIGIRRVGLPSDRPGLRLSYTLEGWTEKRVPVDYAVDLTTTPCRFGGRRYWFLCPGVSCGCRVAKLYRPPVATYYLCRHCHQLTYEGRQRHRNRMYEGVGHYGLCLRRLEAAQSRRMRLKWAVRLLEAQGQVKAYLKDTQARFEKRLERLK